MIPHKSQYCPSWIFACVPAANVILCMCINEYFSQAVMSHNKVTGCRVGISLVAMELTPMNQKMAKRCHVSVFLKSTLDNSGPHPSLRFCKRWLQPLCYPLPSVQLPANTIFKMVGWGGMSDKPDILPIVESGNTHTHTHPCPPHPKTSKRWWIHRNFSETWTDLLVKAHCGYLSWKEKERLCVFMRERDRKREERDSDFVAATM